MVIIETLRRNLGEIGLQALDKDRAGWWQGSVPGIDQPGGSARRRHGQRHDAERAPQEVADHHQARHDRDQVGGMQHLPDEAVGRGAERRRGGEIELGKKMLDLLSDPLTDGRQEQIVAAQFADGYGLQLKDGMIISGEDGDRLLVRGSRTKPSGTAGS